MKCNANQFFWSFQIYKQNRTDENRCKNLTHFTIYNSFDLNLTKWRSPVSYQNVLCATCVSLIFLICRRSKLCSDLMSLYYIFKMQSTFFQSLQITMAAIGGADGNGGDDNGGFDDELRSLPLFTQVYRFLPKATCSALCPPCLCVLAALSVRCVRPVCACWPPCPCVVSALSVRVGRPVRVLCPPCLCVLAALWGGGDGSTFLQRI